MIAMFRGGRVAWSVPLHTIAAAVPEGTVITSLSGDAEVETARARAPAKSKKQLVVGFETPMAEDGSLPARDRRLPRVAAGRVLASSSTSR